MPTQVPHRVARYQVHDARFDGPSRTTAERVARPSSGNDSPPSAGMNPQERVIFTIYVAMATLIVAVLAATGVVWWVGP